MAAVAAAASSNLYTDIDMPNERIHPRARVHPAALEVLTVVGATVPLPKPTAAALRLVCKATRLAVDQATYELILTPAAAEGLRPVGSALTAGLTSLRFNRQLSQVGRFPLLNATLIACKNSTNIEILHLPTTSAYEGQETVQKSRSVVAMLNLWSWPQLRRLTIEALPGIFSDYIDINHVPNLTELELHGELSGVDLTALSRGRRFPLTVETLKFGSYLNEDFDGFSLGFINLLRATSGLKSLSVNAFSFHDLGFLATVPLPFLEHLELRLVPDEVSLDPITAFSRRRLRKLRVCGGTASMALAQPGTFPALEKLEFINSSGYWGFLRAFGSKTLKTLAFEECSMTDIDAEQLLISLTRMPSLEEIQLMLHRIGGHDFDAEDLMRQLVSGRVLPRLRLLVTCYGWADNDASLRCLIEGAKKLPQLEAIIMNQGRISPAMFHEMAAAGRAGRWPHLKAFDVDEFFDEGNTLTVEVKSGCRRVVEEAWPGVKVKIYKEGDE